MGASFLSGVAYSLVSGMPNPIQSAITTGAGFAVFNAIFFQVRGGLGGWGSKQVLSPGTLSPGRQPTPLTDCHAYHAYELLWY